MVGVETQIAVFKCEGCGCEVNKETDDFKNFEEDFYCEDCFNETFSYCDGCEDYFYIDDISFFEDSCYCEDCLNNVSAVCEGCGERYKRDDVYSFDDDYYCESCYNDRFASCRGCENDFCNDDLNNGYCYDCEGEREIKVIELEFKKIKSKTFKQNRFKDFCGFEIETYFKNNEDLFNSDELRSFNINSQKEDGSLGDGGIEFNSNALNGDLLFNSIDSLCGELKKRDYKVDRSCGLHIHIQINKRCEELKKLILFYSKFENYFYRMVAKSRSLNSYCKYIGDMYNTLNDLEVLKIKNNTELKKKIYETKKYNSIKYQTKQHHNNKRYAWLNLHSIFYRGTLEIRLHNGTIDNQKIKNWFNIHLTILEFLKGIKNPETIYNLPKNEEFFLSLFNDNIKDYIKNRWVKFENEVVV